MPKHKPELQKESTSDSAAKTTSSTQAAASTLFRPGTGIGTPELPKLPQDLLQLIGFYLDRKELIGLAQVDRSAYATFYPTIKAAMVKALKELVKQDDTLTVKQLLQGNSNLLLREDQWDPKGKAYQGIETTPYQDTLADVFSEEMRTILEESFPGETDNEKRQQAALQAHEFSQPRFDRLREEKRKIMELTTFAYETYLRRYNAWAAAGYNQADIQPVRDAWMRIDLVQNQWSMRLRKIFSWVSMDENQTFESLPRDLQNPCFYNDPNHPWLPGTIKGCDLRLMSVPDENQDLGVADFITNLRMTADVCPILIRQGGEEEATYHLYAPYISLDRDESEWRMEPINDPTLIQLIRWGRPAPGNLGNGVDFQQRTFPYNSVFDDLYLFSKQRSLHLGSGSSYIFAAYNYAVPGSSLGAPSARVADTARPERVRAPITSQNFAAVSALYEKRKERLAIHLNELLPEQKESPRLGS